MNEDKKNNNSENDIPDLGLSELQGKISAPLLEEEAPAQQPAEEGDGSSLKGGQYQDLFDAGDLTRLLQETEARMRETEDSDIEARIWWIRAGVCSRTLPPMILTGPAEGVLRDFRKENFSAELKGVKPLVKEMLQELAAVLEEGGEKELADHFRAEGIQLIGKEESEEMVSFVAPAEKTDNTEEWKIENPDEGESIVQEELFEQKNSPQSRFVSLFIVFAIAGIAGYFFWSTRQIKDHPPFSELQPEIPALENIELASPLFPKKRVLPHLDPILYEVEKLGSNGAQKKNVSTSDTKDTPLNTTWPTRVNTDGPLEPDAIEKIRKQQTAPRSEQERPPFFAEKLFPEKEKNEFKKEEKPAGSLKKFRAIVNTRLLKRPEYRTVVIGRIRSGTVIQGESVDSRWIRVEKPAGYALRQDFSIE